MFHRARALGLKITVHVAELHNTDDTHTVAETFMPERLGHACCLSEKDWLLLLKQRIPVEICPTSNLKTLAVTTLQEHPFARYLASGHPMIICTDDKGVFNTTLSEEYFFMALAHQLTRKQLYDLALQGLPHVFEQSPAIHSALRNTFEAFLETAKPL